MADACGMWGLGRPDRRTSRPYLCRALLSIRNSCACRGNPTLCRGAAESDFRSVSEAVCAANVLRCKTIECYLTKPQSNNKHSHHASVRQRWPIANRVDPTFGALRPRVKNRDASVRIAGSAGDPAHRLHRHITSRDEYASSGCPSQPATNPVSQLLLLVSQPHPLSSMR